MADKTLSTVLTLVTVALVLFIVWLRARRHGPDTFWNWVERLTWLAALVAAVGAAIFFFRPATNPPAVATPSSTPSPTPTATPTPSTPAPSTPTPEPSGTPTSAPPTTQPKPTVPVSSYVLQPALPPLRIAAPRSSCGRTFADLDEPAVTVNEDDRPGDDLMYWTCSPIGFQRQSAKYLGSATKTRPATAEQCAQLAKVSAVAGSIEPDDLKLDQAFCVVTDEENVAWLRLVKKVKNPSPNDPDLVFQFAVWKLR